jgi:manganese/zinc/iron transport system permease protein
MNLLLDFGFNYTLIIVALGTALLGLVAGILGCFAYLRKQSLLADAISHAALPGIALTFLLTHSKNPSVLLCGGAIAGSIGVLLVALITHNTTLKNDTALGFVLSVFFGLGLVLLTVVQKTSVADQGILNKFLFGNAATLLLEEIWMIGIVGFVLLLCIALLWKEFKIITFDHYFAQSLNYPVFVIELLLTALLVLAIVIGLQTVGIVLMSTLFVAPAAAARQWTSRLSKMVILAGFFGSLSGLIGSIVSSTIDHIPTGPVIVVVMSMIVIISLLVAPHRGLLWQKHKRVRMQ